VALLANIEATDRVGKSTQLAAVADALRAGGLRVVSFSFPDRPGEHAVPHPSHISTGALITRYLRGQMPLLLRSDTLFHQVEALMAEEDAERGFAVARAGAPYLSDGVRELVRGIVEEKIFQVLQSVNRREHLAEMQAALADPDVDVVLCVRLQSAWAYAVPMGVSAVEIRALEGDMPSPALTLLLDIDPAAARSRRGSDPLDLYESNADYQSAVRARYRDLVHEDAAACAATGAAPSWLRIDASGDRESVCAAIVGAITARLPAA
jgi:thymidylate kinase